MTNKDKLNTLEKRIKKLETIVDKPLIFATLNDMMEFKLELNKKVTQLSANIAKELELRRPNTNTMSKPEP